MKLLSPIVGHSFRSRGGMEVHITEVNGIDGYEFVGEVLAGKISHVSYFFRDGRSVDGPGYDLVHHFGPINFENSLDNEVETEYY